MRSALSRVSVRAAQPIVGEGEGLGNRFAEHGAGRNDMNGASDVEFARASQLRRDRITHTYQV